MGCHTPILWFLWDSLPFSLFNSVIGETCHEWFHSDLCFKFFKINKFVVDTSSAFISLFKIPLESFIAIFVSFKSWWPWPEKYTSKKSVYVLWNNSIKFSDGHLNSPAISLSSQEPPIDDFKKLTKWCKSVSKPFKYCLVFFVLVNLSLWLFFSYFNCL